jgi:putative transposase
MPKTPLPQSIEGRLCEAAHPSKRIESGPGKAVRHWLGRVGVETLFIEPGSPWENGYCESFNSKFRDELLNGEMFTTLREAQVLIESWRRHYNAVRPLSSLGYRPPAPEAILTPARGLPYAPLRSAHGLARAAGI